MNILVTGQRNYDVYRSLAYKDVFFDADITLSDNEFPLESIQPEGLTFASDGQLQYVKRIHLFGELHSYKLLSLSQKRIANTAMDIQMKNFAMRIPKDNLKALW